MVFLREHNDSVLASDTSTIPAYHKMQHKYACNDCRETPIDLE